MNPEHWVGFKSSVYLVGLTFILVCLAARNVTIFYELMFYKRHLYAFITFELTAMLFIVWVIGISGIIREWKLELNHDQQTEDYLSSSSS